MTSDDREGGRESWCGLWQRTSEAYLGGVQHALNNRLASLSAVAQVLSSGMAGAQPLVDSLAAEVERLHATVSLLSLLRRSRTAAPEPIQLPQLLDEVLTLLPHHGELKEVGFAAEGDPSILPVLAERDQLTRVLLVLLTEAGWSAQQQGRTEARVRYQGDDSEVVVRVERCRGAEGVDVWGVEEVVRTLGGQLRRADRTDGEVDFEVRLPTLLEARRRERAMNAL